MEKITVSFEGGQSRNGTESVNFMMAKVEDTREPKDIETLEDLHAIYSPEYGYIELYAEIVVPDDTDDDYYGYDDLKAQIIEQAAAAGIEADRLRFQYD